jgi:hypothetical protein
VVLKSTWSLWSRNMRRTLQMGRSSWTDVATRSLPAYSTACRPKSYLNRNRGEGVQGKLPRQFGTAGGSAWFTGGPAEEVVWARVAAPSNGLRSGPGLLRACISYKKQNVASGNPLHKKKCGSEALKTDERRANEQ